MRKFQSILKAVCTGVFVLLSVSTFAQEDKVSFAKEYTTVANERPLKFDIDYVASDAREIMLSLKEPGQKNWIAGSRVKVKKGSGTVTIKLNRKEGFKNGNNFDLNVSILPVGGKWKDTTAKDRIHPLTIGDQTANAEPTEDLVAIQVSSVTVNTNGVAFVEVEYTALDKRLIAVQIKDPKTKEEIASGRKTVNQGTGSVKIRLTKKEGIKKGANFHLIVSTRPVGTTWKEIISKKGIKPFTVK